ncbi:MAG TPA: hypothetical protein VMT85_11605 [Thermoanaerobaculia bacterium]|nr:hypothetical protein [Thermoanaerobaculia bacterium]
MSRARHAIARDRGWATTSRVVAIASVLAAAVAALPAASSAAAGSPRLATLEPEPAGFTLAVLGLDRAQLEELRASDRSGWPQWFSLHVSDVANPPVAARYALVDDRVELRPRFPLERGLEYVAAFRPGVLAGGADADGAAILEQFELPRVDVTPTTRVIAIQPSRGLVPENLLKFYVHFSAPMTRGRAYRHLRILDSRGREVELAFLELEYELWDPESRRLTLLFDPGRLKAGLKPHREVGPALAGGFDFALEVDADWPDAEGNPLRQGLVHEFWVGPPDYEQPTPESWAWSQPRAGTREPLAIGFGEPLDGALLQHSLWVVELGEAGETERRIEGVVELAQGESIWRFTPNEPWRPTRHELRVDPLLEDLAGNSLARPFEVDLAGGGSAVTEGSEPAPARGPRSGAELWRRSFVPAP